MKDEARRDWKLYIVGGVLLVIYVAGITLVAVLNGVG